MNIRVTIANEINSHAEQATAKANEAMHHAIEAGKLLLGANAISIAHGTKGMADGMSVALDEDMDDRKHDHILFFEMIFGADKTQFDGLDYGQITVDTAFTAAV